MIGRPPSAPPLPYTTLPRSYRSLPDTASADTMLFIPVPSADQLLPSHLAMLLAALPPALLNPPPAYRSLPDTASAYTNELSPKTDPDPAHLPPPHHAPPFVAMSS